MKKKLKGLFLRYKELVFYCIIGSCGASLDFVVYIILSKCFNMHYQFANFISVSTGIINNFFLNFCFNFKVRDKMALRLARFYCIGLFGWILSAAMLWLLVEKLFVNMQIAKVGTIFFVTAVQFMLNKNITFRKYSKQ